MNIRLNKKFLYLPLLFCVAPVYAGDLVQDHVALDLNQLSRSSDVSTTYVYNNNGTVNSSGDDIPVGSTSRFDDDANLGYQFSASKQFAKRWAVHVNIMRTEMDSDATDNSSIGRLEIFRLPLTNEFDSAHIVTANYNSKWAMTELSGVFSVSKNIDLLLGLGKLSLDETFKVTSNDTAVAGVGVYTINTSNDLQGVHFGVALNHRLGKYVGVYAQGTMGWYNNDTSQNQYVDDTSFTRTNSGSSSANSQVTNIRLGATYHFNEQLTFDLGYQKINITNVALAESHFNTSIAGSNTVIDNTDLQWSGYNLGVRYQF